jgi:hypothetical protein
MSSLTHLHVIPGQPAGLNPESGDYLIEIPGLMRRIAPE